MFVVFVHAMRVSVQFQCGLFSVGKIDIGTLRLNFWDLGGQEELQSLWDKVSDSSGLANLNLTLKVDSSFNI